MAKRLLPDQALLLKLLRYEPETGELFWLERTPDIFPSQKNALRTCAAFNTRFAGKLATGSPDSYGYLQIKILGRLVLLHRLVWKMVTGYEPDEIDHINGRRSDNRFSNLRPASHAENCKNRAVESRNKSGVSGVTWQSGKWRARMKVDGRDITLGSFAEKDDAIRARKSAEREYGFHPNHGRRAN